MMTLSEGDRPWLAVAALSGLLAVVLGAFAAHGLKATDGRAAELVETASRYQMYHALAMLAALALVQGPIAVCTAFALGTVLFCGSLYALALGAPSLVGAVTPFGGLAFIAGWGLLAWRALRP